MPSLWAAPNLLSFSRIVAAPIIYALIVSSARYGFLLALILFIAASLTDTVDGEIARRRGLVSALGSDHPLISGLGHSQHDDDRRDNDHKRRKHNAHWALGYPA